MRLYFFTNQFPYGKAEKSFIAPEIEALKSYYDVTVVSCALEGVALDDEDKSDLPEGVSLIHVAMPTGYRYAIFGLAAIFSESGREELVRVWSSGDKRLSRLVYSFYTYGAACEYRKRFEKAGIFEDCDEALYFAFWFHNACVALSLEKQQKPKMILISRIHGYDLYNERHPTGRQPWHWYKRKQCERIIFAADSPMRYFSATFGEERFSGQYVINRLGVQKSKIKKQLHSKKFRLVSCSSVVPLKRVRLIAEAVQLIGSARLEWIHFGDGDLAHELLNYCSANNIECDWRGHMPNDEVIEFYRNNYVDAFITVSSTEGGCPVSIQEAISFGIPVIGTDVGGIPELIDGNGILLPPNPTAEEVAQAISTMMSADDESVSKMRQRSFDLWAERFNLENNKRELLEIIRQVVKERS